MDPVACLWLKIKWSVYHANDETDVLCHWCPHINRWNVRQLLSVALNASRLNHPSVSFIFQDRYWQSRDLIDSFNSHQYLVQAYFSRQFIINPGGSISSPSALERAAHTMPQSCVTKATPLYGRNFPITDVNISNEYEKIHSFIHPAIASVRDTPHHFLLFPAN